ncbi:MAG TPA: hypothetical protein VE218_06400, partial [Acidobacteriaceae bacterium]|nr:hypothetical protein [Acidobacteriaceae bacterium]
MREPILLLYADSGLIPESWKQVLRPEGVRMIRFALRFRVVACLWFLSVLPVFAQSRSAPTTPPAQT